MNKELNNFITEIFNLLKENKEGNVASYIPQLAQVDPDKFSISICTIDGTTFDIGDSDDMFCMQSCSKPLSYCIARELSELKKVHNHVGYEPSGRAFNAFTLNRQKLPHNPLINAGAIMIASLINPNEEPSKRFETVKNFYQKMTGNNGNIGFDNSVFLSEKHHADRNISLAYYMRENNAFEENTGPSEISSHLDLYFQCCSININTKMGSCIAATLANGGVCPQNRERIFKEEITRDCLSLMYMCGMYDYSGQFAFEIGLPAKSGVSGCLFLVIPNKMGICIWSPRLDELGNTVRGVEFCKLFTEKTNKKYHIFRTITNKNKDKLLLENKLITACSKNDLHTVISLSKQIDLNISDYDKRTPLHLACSEGNIEIVKFLLENNCNKNVKDRWDNTPLTDAKKSLDKCIDDDKKKNFNQIIDLLN